MPKDDGDEPVLGFRRGLPTANGKPLPEERALRSKSGKQRRSQNPDPTVPIGTPSAPPSVDPPARAQPRYLVTFDGLMEVPDMDDTIESLEREVEVIRNPALC